MKNLTIAMVCGVLGATAGGCALNERSEALGMASNGAGLGAIVDLWHDAAARGDWDTYASLMTDDIVFLGTDKTERWVGQEFADFARPYFDGPTEYGDGAWTYRSLSRTVEVRGGSAWWDEVLVNEAYGHCRGTGVLVRDGGDWRITHYALAFLIPNDIAPDVTRQGLEHEAANE